MQYEVIYADPPWRYSFSKSRSRRIENQYPTMSTDGIGALSVPAAKNCVLFLWATAPKLADALEVMAAWGFQYKTHMVWVKTSIGMGYWFRGQHELLLVGTKGQAKPPLPEQRIPSVFTCARGKHSCKPRWIRDWIARTFPEARRIELCARERVEGWDAWGNEVPAEAQVSAAPLRLPVEA